MDIAVRADAAENPDEQRAALDVAAIYESALPRLLRIAAGMGLGRPDAEDALHDAYVALLKNRDKLADGRHAQRWLTRVMVNRCRLHHRERKRHDRLLADFPVETSFPPPSAADAQAVVRQALHELDGDALAILVLRYFCELNASEIGEILEMPAATVRGQLRRARMRLAERLMEKGLTDDAD